MVSAKSQIISFYNENTYEEHTLSENDIFERELASIVMQMVGVIMNKARQGVLFPKDSASQNQNIMDEQMRKYLRDLDFNILHCDVMDIIRQILMKVCQWIIF